MYRIKGLSFMDYLVIVTATLSVSSSAALTCLLTEKFRTSQ